jgi:hypothetical protein
MGGQRMLYPSDRFTEMEKHMDNLITRFSQALLAVAATGASAIILQMAMVAA